VTLDRLVVHDLSVAYGETRVVRQVSLRVAAGEVVALLGRNGAGKTSTLMAIAGGVPPAGGTVALDGVPVAGQPAHAIARRGLSLVPQGRRIFSTLTVRENLTLGSRGGSLAEVLAVFPALRARLRARGSALSGGEQQMLAIGRALMTRPRLLLMDEPSEGLAPAIVRRIGELIGELRRAGDLSLLIAEQNLALALHLADRVCVLERGEVVYAGSAGALRDDRGLQHRYLGV
jgi:branched-chain amino acid transport system ATP-binding protein